jgi:ABC-type sulfate/molybdate transport systems ATPase subunit
MTIVMVTHDPKVSERCQRIVRLADGVVETDVRQTPTRPVRTRVAEPAPQATPDSGVEPVAAIASA